MRYLKRTISSPLILSIIITLSLYAVLLPQAFAFSTDQAQQVLAGVQGAIILLPLGIGFATFFAATAVAHVSALPSIIISGSTAVIIFIAMWSVVPTFVQNAMVAQDASNHSIPTGPVPNAPLGLIANAVSTNEIDLSWIAPPQPVTGYFIEYSLDNDVWNTFISNTGSTATTYAATGLLSGTQYYFRVSGINNAGTGLPSNVATDITFGVPGTPTDLAYNSPSPTEIDLTWIPPINNGGTPIVGYKIERAFPATSNPASFSTLVANTGNVTSYHDISGITASTTFSYRVSTLNNVATSSPTAPINATSDPPAVSNSTGTVKTGIAVCPSTTKLLSLNTTNANGSMIIIAPTQFLTTSAATKSVNVYLNQNGTLVAHNQMSIRLGGVNTENMYTTLFYNSNAPTHAAYEIDACTTAGSVNAISKIISIFGKTNVSYTNGTLTTLGGTDTTLASTSFSSSSGNNVILGNLGIQSLSASTGHFTIDSFKIKNTAGSTISSNKLGLDIGGSAPSSTMYTLLVGGETSAPGSQTYTITGLRPNVTFNARVEMLVFSVPQLSFSNGASVFVGLATTPLATLSTTLASGSSALGISSTIYNNTSSSPVNIPANHNYITNGSTIASNSFLLTPFANGGSFGDSFISELVGVVSSSGASPTFTTNADANITGTNSATQAIAFQLSGVAATIPTNLKTPTQNSSAIKLTWTAPTTNGGFPITGYTVMQDSGSGFVKRAQIGNVTTYTATGLTSGTFYNYKVAALNALGNSTFSTPSQNYTTTAAPTALKVNTFNSTMIKLSWTAPSGYKNGYKIYRESPTGNGFATLVSNTTNTLVNYNNTGLTTGTQYNYKISAINTGGFSLNSSSVANFTTNTQIFMTNGAAVQVTSVCSTYTNILNVTGTSGSNLVFVNGQFASNSAVTKQVGFKVIDSVSGAVLANNKTSIRLNTAGTWNSYMLVGSEASSPANPIFQVFACTSGNSILAKARAVVINGYSGYLTTTGATTLVHYYDVDKQIASIATTSTFSTGPNVLIANIGIVGNASAPIKVSTGAVKIKNGATDLSDNRAQIYVGSSAPTSSPSFTLVGIDNTPGATPTYTINANMGNNTNMQASLAVLHVSSAFFVDGVVQTFAADPSLTTLSGPLSTTFPTGATVATFASSLFNNTATSIKTIPLGDYQLKRDSTLLTNNTIVMRAFNPSKTWGDSFNGAHVYVESLSSPNPSYSVLAAANQSSSINGYAKILTFCLTCASTPGAPTGLTATEFNATQTNLSWTAPSSNGGSAITGYEVDRQFNGSGSFVNIKSAFGNVTSYNDNTRTGGYTYSYQVKAINSAGSGTASNTANITPLLLAIFTVNSNSTIDAIINKHMTPGDIGVNSFGGSTGNFRLEHFPTFQKQKLYCTFTSNSTKRPFCAENYTNFHGSPVTFHDKISGSKIIADYETANNPPMNGMWYDPEPDNPNDSTPPWETGFNKTTLDDSYNNKCPKPNKNYANSCLSYYANQGATAVHSYGYLYGVAPTGQIQTGPSVLRTNNSTYTYCLDVVVKRGLFDHACGGLFNMMNGTKWSNVDYLDVQSQGWINNTNTAQVVDEFTKIFNYVHTNSTGHTKIIAETNFDKYGPASQVQTNLLAIRNYINGTNDVCSSTGTPPCSATNLDNVWTALKR